jgi:hypothetical protein
LKSRTVVLELSTSEDRRSPAHPVSAQIDSVSLLWVEDATATVYVRGSGDDLSISRGGVSASVRLLEEMDILSFVQSDLSGPSIVLVTYGGSTSSLPFLTFRCIVREVPLLVRLEHNRWRPGPHVDLVNVLTHTGSIAPCSLVDIMRAIGEEDVPGVQSGGVDQPLSLAERMIDRSVAIALLYFRCHKVLSGVGQIG